MTTLHSRRQNAIGLKAALKALAPQTLTGFCLTPASFCFATWQDGLLRHAPSLAPNQIYEARFFNADIELRWLRDPANDHGVGTAVCLAETAIGPAGWETLPPLEGLAALPDSNRFMTGTLAAQIDQQTGWPLMNAPRHGAVAVPLVRRPLAGNAGKRPAYIVREFLGLAPGSAGSDGNLMVVEERILGIEIAEQRK